MSAESCFNCRFWSGSCRRYPPMSQRYEYENTRKGYTESDVLVMWPETSKDDWCGEWQKERSPEPQQEPKRRPDHV